MESASAVGAGFKNKFEGLIINFNYLIFLPFLIFYLNPSRPRTFSLQVAGLIQYH